MRKTTGEGGLAQRLWRRYQPFTTAPHTQLARRVYRAQGGPQPLLHSLQRRWLPGSVGSFSTRSTLPYVMPPAATPALTTAVAGAALSSRNSNPLPPARTQEVVQRTSSRAVSPALPAPTAVVGVAQPAPAPVLRSAGQPVATMPLPTVIMGPALQRRRGSAAGDLPLAVEPPTASALAPSPQAAHTTPSSLPTQGAALPVQAVMAHPLIKVNRQALPGHAPAAVKVTSAPLPSVGATHSSTSAPLVPLPTSSVSPGLVQREPLSTGAVYQLPLVVAAKPVVAVAARRAKTAASSLPGVATPAPVRRATVANNLGSALLQRQALPLPPPGAAPLAGAATPVVVYQGVTQPASAQRALVAPQMVRPALSRTAAPAAASLPVARAVAAPPAPVEIVTAPLQSAAAAPAMNGLTALPLVVNRSTNAGEQSLAPTLQRQTAPRNGLPASNGEESASTGNQALGTPAGSNQTPPTAPMAGADPAATDALAEQVWRKLLRRLAVEGERRGGRPWP